MPSSEGVATGLVLQEEDQKNKETRFLSVDEERSRKFYLDRIENAKQQRHIASEFFDDMSYEEDYEYNRQAANSYLRKKNNDAEVRVNTGTTEKKLEVLANKLIAMNLQHEIRAFDEDDLEVESLGQDFSDLVSRTNEIEKDDDMWIEAIYELLTQRAVFVEELFDERTVYDKRRVDRILTNNAKPFKFDRVKYTTQMARKRVVSGLQIFLGDILMPSYLFQFQPYIVKYCRMSYDEARTIFGSFANWNRVKTDNMHEDMQAEQDSTEVPYRFGIIGKNDVEVIYVMSYPEDDYQVMIDGQMMFAPGEPLPWEYPGYNMTMTTLKPMSRTFAYGKPPVASAKTLQALDNETIRMMIFKFRQSLKPPMAMNGAKKVYSRDIWDPGSVTYGLRKENFEKLIDHDGITNSEFSMYDLINKKIEEFIGVSDTAQGIDPAARTTATQILQQQKAALENVGLAVGAVMRLKRDLTYLRLFNILENYTKSVKMVMNPFSKKIEDVFRRFTVFDSNFDDGKSGKKIVQFMNRDLQLQEEDSIMQKEMEQETLGNQVRIRTINVKKLREIPLTWYVVINSQERKGSALDKVMFQDQLNQAMVIQKASGGEKQINWDEQTNRFERTWGTTKMFKKVAPSQINGGAPGDPNAQDQMDPQQMMDELDKMQNDDPRKMVAGQTGFQTQKPSVNTVVNNT